MRAYEFLIEGYKEVAQKFVASGADPQQVKVTLQTFKELVGRNQITDANEKNIDWWGKNKTFADLEKLISSKSTRTKTQAKRSKIPGKSITLIDDNRWFVVVPLNKDASCFHGRNTKWCTTKTSARHFEEYFYRGVTLVYCINKINGKKWAIAISPEEVDYQYEQGAEYFDENDSGMSARDFKEETGLDPKKVIKLAIYDYKNDALLTAAREEGKAEELALQKKLEGLKDRDPEFEQQIMNANNANIAEQYFNAIRRNLISVHKPLSLQRGEYQDFVEICERLPEKLATLVVTTDPHAYEYLRYHPSEQFHKQTIKTHPYNISHIKNPSEALQMIAVENAPDYHILEYIKNPARNVLIKSIQNSQGRAIDHIPNADAEIQLMALKLNPMNFYGMRNATPEAVEFFNDYMDDKNNAS